MRAIILAAGRGSRLYELTEEKPKCLVKLIDKPLIEWQMKALRDAGIDKIAIVKGYKSDAIKYRSVKYFYNLNWHTTNMVYSLMCADNWLKKHDCVISYSDIVYKSNIIKKIMNVEEDISLTYDVNWLELWENRFSDPFVDAETFKVDHDGNLLEIGNKPQSLTEIQGQYMGILKIRPNGYKKILKYLNDCGQHFINNIDMTALLSNLLCVGVNIKAIPVKEDWFEIDTQNDLKLCSNMIIEKKLFA